MLTNTLFHNIEFSYTNIHTCRKEGKKEEGGYEITIQKSMILRLL